MSSPSNNIRPDLLDIDGDEEVGYIMQLVFREEESEVEEREDTESDSDSVNYLDDDHIL
jgi:hypothetical protein